MLGDGFAHVDPPPGVCCPDCEWDCPCECHTRPSCRAVLTAPGELHRQCELARDHGGAHTCGPDVWISIPPSAATATVALPRALVERIRDEAQVLAAVFPATAAVPWGRAHDAGLVHTLAIAWISGAACALGMTPASLLEAAEATW